jgi:hypothetical protein
MPIRREVKMGGARFGKVPGSDRKVLTPQEREDGFINVLRVILRRLARRLGVPRDQVNQKVTRLLTRFRALVRDEFRS